MSGDSPKKPKRDSVLAWLKGGSELLAKSGVARPRLLCEHALSRALGCQRLELYSERAKLISPAQSSLFDGFLKRLSAGEPLAYVLGDADFMGNLFRLNRACLIPRPETEELVEWVTGFEPLWERERPQVADVGTGCGCIAVTLALCRPNGAYLALDISSSALQMAHKNARALGVSDRIQFRVADLLSRVKPLSLDAVISNPPYVSEKELAGLDAGVRCHEPYHALVGGVEGLELMERLAGQAFLVLKQGGYLFMEIGAGQWRRVISLLARAGFKEIVSKKDALGKIRMVRAEKKGK